MSKSRPKPVDYAAPDLSSERVARMWEVIERRQVVAAPRRARMLGLALAACLLLGLVTVVSLQSGQTVEQAATGDLILTDRKTAALTLPDGSSLQVGAATELSVLAAQPTEIRLSLRRGTALCDVVHRRDRRFIVETEDLTVQVKGTRFAVEVTPVAAASARVSVRVERGLVEVRRKNGALIATLAAGQTWSQQAVEPVHEQTDEPTEASPEPPPATPEPSPAVPTNKAHDLLSNRPQPTDASALFERANAARLAGRALDAAQAYDKLRARFPADPRAGLAAFELARIRLDTLHDEQGALRALRFALSHQGPGFAEEDAEALQLDALDRLGQSEACKAKQSVFLARHPRSAHLARVSHACRD